MPPDEHPMYIHGAKKLSLIFHLFGSVKEESDPAAIPFDLARISDYRPTCRQNLFSLWWR